MREHQIGGQVATFISYILMGCLLYAQALCYVLSEENIDKQTDANITGNVQRAMRNSWEQLAAASA